MASSSDSSTWPGTTAAASTRRRPPTGRRATRASTASRTVAGSAVAGREHFRDEERVASGVAVQLDRVDAAWLGEHAHGVEAQRLERDPCDGAGSREAAQDDAEGHGLVDFVVPVRGDDQRADGFDTTTEQPQNIEVAALQPSGGPRGPVQLGMPAARRRAREDLVRRPREPPRSRAARRSTAPHPRTARAAGGEERVTRSLEYTGPRGLPRRRMRARAPSCRSRLRRRRPRGARSRPVPPRAPCAEGGRSSSRSSSVLRIATSSSCHDPECATSFRPS